MDNIPTLQDYLEGKFFTIEIDGKEQVVFKDLAKESDVDYQYCELMKKLMNVKYRKKNRTGIDTLSKANQVLEFDLKNIYPILETKKVKADNYMSEIYWIHILQSNVVEWLRKHNNYVWDEWEIGKDGIYRTFEQGDNAVIDSNRKVALTTPTGELILNKSGEQKYATVTKADRKRVYDKAIRSGKTKEEAEKLANNLTIKEAKFYGKKWAGTIGTAYGYITNLYKKLQEIEHELKYNPGNRRLNLSLWQDGFIPTAVLPSCVWDVTFTTEICGIDENGKEIYSLNAVVNQRSADVPLGLPFNLGQYAALIIMLADSVGMEPGRMTYVIADAHIYSNQLDGAKKQVNRHEYLREYTEFIGSKDFNNKEDLCSIKTEYLILNDTYNILLEEAKKLVNKEFTKESAFLKELKRLDNDLAIEYEEAKERLNAFKHLLTRENPKLELKHHDSIFDYSENFEAGTVDNPTGHDEIKIKKYTNMGFISYPIAQ